LEKERNLDATNAYGMPFEVEIKVGARYMVASNIDLMDGIVNGSAGYLEATTPELATDGSVRPLLLWVRFSEASVGANAREKFRYARTSNISNELTPLKLETKAIVAGSRGVLTRPFTVTRTQFSVVCAEGITVHKSQGSTCPLVAYHIPTAMHRDRLYVACSRVTKAEDLFLIGRFVAPIPRGETCEVAQELRRLETRRITFQCRTWPELAATADALKIVFHNMEGYRAKGQCTFADPIFAEADVVLLAETWTQLTNCSHAAHAQIMRASANWQKTSTIA
jgi:hypothetical protein